MNNYLFWYFHYEIFSKIRDILLYYEKRAFIIDFSIGLIDKTLTYINSDIDNKLFSCLPIACQISSAIKSDVERSILEVLILISTK